MTTNDETNSKSRAMQITFPKGGGSEIDYRSLEEQFDEAQNALWEQLTFQCSQAYAWRDEESLAALSQTIQLLIPKLYVSVEDYRQGLLLLG